jgi:nucleotidyltransferase substrate binding protein (TIGR01987 family)
MQIRWVERFENFKKALTNFQETIACIEDNGINKIYTMALIQAFEIVFELSWKTIKDYLEFNGIKTDTPRETIKEAFSKNIIINGQIWIEMMEARNKTSRTYKEEYANELVSEILNNYAPLLNKLAIFLEGKING